MTGLFLVAKPAENDFEPDTSTLRHLLGDLLDMEPEGGVGRIRTREAPDARVRRLPVLADLASALRDLATGARIRAVVRLCAEPAPWELGLERSGPELLLTVFHPGEIPDVWMHERSVEPHAFAERVLEALGNEVMG